MRLKKALLMLLALVLAFSSGCATDKKTKKDDKKKKDVKMSNELPLSLEEALNVWIVPATLKIKANVENITEDEVRAILRELDQSVNATYAYEDWFDSDFKRFYYEAGVFNAVISLSVHARKITLSRMITAAKNDANANESVKNIASISEEELDNLPPEKVEEIARAYSQNIKASKEAQQELDRCFVYLSIADAALGSLVTTSVALIAFGTDLIVDFGQSIQSLQSNPLAAIQVVQKTASLTGLKKTVENIRDGSKQIKPLIKDVRALKAAIKNIEENEESSQDA